MKIVKMRECHMCGMMMVHNRCEHCDEGCELAGCMLCKKAWGHGYNGIGPTKPNRIK